MRIGFIGLGNMGGPMAANLIKAGYRLIVFDLSADAIARLVRNGARSSDTPKAVAEASDVVITMLPAAQHVRAVYGGEDGVLAGARSGVALIDSSTIDPGTARDLARAAAAQANPFADAPVSGGTGGARAATLTFMVGAMPELFATIKPVLGGMGRNIIHCGDVGTGQTAKICNNLVLGVSMIAVAEAMSLGVALGIDAHVLAAIMNSSTGRCWAADTNNPYPGVVESAPSSRGYAGGFGTNLMLKDMGLAVEAAGQVRQPVMMAGLAQQLYSLLSQAGCGQKDFSSVIKLYQTAVAEE